jgi:beta-glucosidase
LAFLWGAAVAAHQVEGDNIHSDWWAEEERGRLPYKSGRACDFWNRWKDDFDLLASLGHSAFRFSIEWARVQPQNGRFDEAALARYVEMVKDLRRRGIEPIVTLHHFTNPLWFAQAGGFEKKVNIGLFLRFVDYVVAALGPHVRYWVTINEPMVYAYQSWSVGIWPPFKKDTRLALLVLGNLLEAHAGAYAIIHRHQPQALVSIAKHVRVIQPYRPWHPGDCLAARLQDYLANEAVLRAFATGRFLRRRILGLRGSWDYVGLNYYTRNRVRFVADPTSAFGREMRPQAGTQAAGPATGQSQAGPGPVEVNTLGWETYPEGFYQALRRLGRYGKPVLVCENGICAPDDDDLQRVRYLEAHLEALARARRDGVDVAGYLYWTLVDNFEWAEGYGPHFGLLAMDPATLERRPRPSAAEFTRLVEKLGS